MPKVNWPIALLGILFWYLETRHFGWNTHPESAAELFADGFSLLFYAMAIAFPPRGPTITITFGKDSGGAGEVGGG